MFTCVHTHTHTHIASTHQQLWGPMPIMLWCAIVIEIAIQNWVDFAILLVILFTNATLSWYDDVLCCIDCVFAYVFTMVYHMCLDIICGVSGLCLRVQSTWFSVNMVFGQHRVHPFSTIVKALMHSIAYTHHLHTHHPYTYHLHRYETIKARNAVAALQASLRPTATAKRDGTWQVVDAAVLVPGDLVLLASGSAVPADCMVCGLLLLCVLRCVMGCIQSNHANFIPTHVQHMTQPCLSIPPNNTPQPPPPPQQPRSTMVILTLTNQR